MSSFVECIDKVFIYGKICMFHFMELVLSFHKWDRKEVIFMKSILKLFKLLLVYLIVKDD